MSAQVACNFVFIRKQNNTTFRSLARRCFCDSNVAFWHSPLVNVQISTFFTPSISVTEFIMGLGQNGSVKSSEETHPTSFHFGGANGGKKATLSPAFAPLGWKEVV